MFLRKENEDDAAKGRRAAIDRQILELREALNVTPSLDDARIRLDLAALLSWRGEYRPVLNLITPLTGECFPVDISIEARQMVADIYFRHDQYDLANRTYHENLAIARESGDEYWVARARDGIAWVLVDVGDCTTGEFVEAQKVFEETLPLHRSFGMKVPEAMAHYGLSRAAAGMGRYDEAAEHAMQAIEMMKEHGNDYLLQLPLLQLGNVYRDRSAYDRALPFYRMAIDAADHSQDPYSQALIAFHYGLLLKWMDDGDSARWWWNSVLPTIAELEFPRLGSEICHGLAGIAANRSEFAEAYRLQIESQTYGNKVGVISPILQNQQMVLRTALHLTGQLENRLNYLTAGVQASEDGIFVIGYPDHGMETGEFVIHFANSAAAGMFGRKPADITHLLIGTVWKSPTASRILEPSRRVYETGERCSLDPVELEFKVGNSRWYSVKIAKIIDGIAWTVSDVTERERMRQEILAQRDRLAEQNDRLLALDKEKSEVLGIAAHDLRSPIGNIRALCDLIVANDPQSQKHVSLIEASADSLLSLISKLLDIERIEHGDLNLEIKEIAFAPTLSQIVEQYAAGAKEKQIAVTLQVHDESATMFADESALHRAVQNLLSNALKFSPVGSSVQIRTSSTGGNYRIEIQDQGPGISESDRRILFRKFARLSARPTAGESSSGLGLSIVKHLLEAMNGQVGCESIPGDGTTFWIELPAPAR